MYDIYLTRIHSKYLLYILPNMEYTLNGQLRYFFSTLSLVRHKNSFRFAKTSIISLYEYWPCWHWSFSTVNFHQTKDFFWNTNNFTINIFRICRKTVYNCTWWWLKNSKITARRKIKCMILSYFFMLSNALLISFSNIIKKTNISII